MTAFDIPPHILAIHEAAQEMYRRHNHTFSDQALLKCTCGAWWILLQRKGETARVYECESCGDWHTVLFT